jgi:hypothetical protein
MSLCPCEDTDGDDTSVTVTGVLESPPFVLTSGAYVAVTVTGEADDEESADPMPEVTPDTDANDPSKLDTVNRV